MQVCQPVSEDVLGSKHSRLKPLIHSFPTGFSCVFRQVFNNMHANKIAGDVVAFNAALSALDRGSQWQEDSFDQVNHYRFGRFGIA